MRLIDTISRYRLPLSIALLVPALVFVTANVLRYELGMPGFHQLLGPVIDPAEAWAQRMLDAVVFVGPLAAFALTVLSVLRLRVERRAHAFVGTVELRWQPGLLVVAAVSAVVFAFLGAYVVLENLPCLVGAQPHC